MLGSFRFFIVFSIFKLQGDAPAKYFEINLGVVVR
jgi:hypothetical protein